MYLHIYGIYNFLTVSKRKKMSIQYNICLMKRSSQYFRIFCIKLHFKTSKITINNSVTKLEFKLDQMKDIHVLTK